VSDLNRISYSIAMKYFISQFKKILPILVVITIAALPAYALASYNPIDWVLPWSTNVISGTVSFIGNMILSALAVFVTATGLFLSISINITLHIKDIYDSVESVKYIWIFVRDLSSMFIIFVLLYYSIKTILGQADGKVRELIVKVFLAGLFINFSLFFVRIATDASNLVSLQFYNAIAPETTQNYSVDSAFYDGGISNIMLQSLKIQKIYSTATVGQNLDMTTSVFFSIIGGIIIMVTAAFSFLAASIAFTARTAIILFVMILSPLYFAGIIFPELKKSVSDKLLDLFKSQLIFMPVYLFLMYIALRLISDPKFNAMFKSDNIASASGAQYAYTWSAVIIQYTIAIVFINIPLIAAISLSGKTGFLMKWAPQAEGISRRIGGFFGRNTLGRAARYAGKEMDRFAAQKTFFGSENFRSAGKIVSKYTKYTGVPTLLDTAREGVRGGLESGEKSKYGGKFALKDREDTDKKYKQKTAEDQHAQDTKVKVEKAITDISNPSLSGKSLADAREKLKTALSKMNSKEVEGLKEKLANPEVAAALSGKQAEAILKNTADISEADRNKFKEKRVEGLINRIEDIGSSDMENHLKEDFDEEQKSLLKKAREDALRNFVDKGDLATLPKYMKKLSGKELAKMDKALLTDPLVIANLKKHQLEDMENLDDETIKIIGNTIYNWLDDHHTNHPAYDHINKNKSMWTDRT
jgi:hypothetical protein